MPWNLLIIPLIAGYLLRTKSFFFKYTQQRLDQQRLIFESVFYGISLIIITYLVRIVIELIPFTKPVIPFLYKFLPIKEHFAGTSLATLFVAIGIWLLNVVLTKAYQKKRLYSAIDDVGNELEKVMKESLLSLELLQITLNSGKFYIGFMKELPAPTIYNYIRLIPFASGYREDKTKNLIPSTQYLTLIKDRLTQLDKTIESLTGDELEKAEKKRLEEIKNELNKMHLDITIPLDKIISVSYFNPKTFTMFNPNGVIPFEEEPKTIEIKAQSIIINSDKVSVSQNSQENIEPKAAQPKKRKTKDKNDQEGK